MLINLRHIQDDENLDKKIKCVLFATEKEAKDMEFDKQRRHTIMTSLQDIQRQNLFLKHLFESNKKLFFFKNCRVLPKVVPYTL